MLETRLADLCDHRGSQLGVSDWLTVSQVVSDAGSAVNYGLDRVRFPSPVPAGAAVRGSGELVEVTDLPGGGVQTTTRVTVRTADGAKPAAVADVLTRFVP